jgi:uncharacterized membrane protein YfcA
MQLQLYQWILGFSAALFVGISKTGIPGLGILVVVLLANVFGGRPSVGIMLPMLISADIFAVTWYRRHCQWNTLIGMLPWVLIGMGCGAAALWATGRIGASRDILNIIIGMLTLGMLGLFYLQKRLSITPRSSVGIVSTGVAAGFATTVSNAAGPIMSIYLQAHKLNKEQFMGTIAWYFFIINVSKLPIYILLTLLNPTKPIITIQSLLFNVLTFPAILAGVFAGKWILPRIPQKTFEIIILALAGISALKLIFGG